MRIVIVAGEASGDLLGGGLIEALKSRFPDAQFEGITGPRMRAAGCESWGDYEQLAVMGLFEVLRHIPRILGVKRDIERRLRANPPDLYIGIDAPDFNLRIEKFARRAGIPTVHYVCPSVWAWRSGRVKNIRAACDLVLCLLPFEADFLKEHGVRGAFVGHPLAEELAEAPDRQSARQTLGLQARQVLAILPGSRMGEVRYLGEAFVQTAAWLRERRPDLEFVVPAARPAIREAMERLAADAGLAGCMRVTDGGAREAVAAADAVLLASGTATLETLLLQRAMVVSYKVSGLTAWVLRNSGLVNIDRFSLPNLLAGEELVQELLQEEATAEILGPAVLELLVDGERREAMVARFAELGEQLRQGANEKAAAAVAELLA